ncbi:MAG: hypothetical protein M1365_09545 [Actinobacteria bacterium]|nr:hypothetical protein [Actinomycetota bacterium]
MRFGQRTRTHNVNGITWWIALILLILAVLLNFNIIRIPVISEFSFWIAVASSALLLIATRIRAL